jgi:hypothetical protein
MPKLLSAPNRIAPVHVWGGGEVASADGLPQPMAHLEVSTYPQGSNHLSFLPLFYSGRRSTLFLFLESTSLVSTTQDRVLLDAVAFLLAHKGLHSKWLAASHAPLSEDNVGGVSI